ncbi:hypothetical protein UY3_12339 [Chelonia mydas]|uniref:Uncharacterized protein n=1 Tax=Chelonia mydas TaxID=8469 RepID=M7BQV1_CHEMY|nr:hypothetical protein UY3_12339 [Chelonia mydas]
MEGKNCLPEHHGNMPSKPVSTAESAFPASVRYEIPAGNSQWNFNHTQLRNPSSKPGASDRSKFLDTNARIERSFQDKTDPEGGRGRERESKGEHQSVSPRLSSCISKPSRRCFLEHASSEQSQPR